jgi:hypothetical protein
LAVGGTADLPSIWLQTRNKIFQKRRVFRSPQSVTVRAWRGDTLSLSGFHPAGVKATAGGSAVTA